MRLPPLRTLLAALALTLGGVLLFHAFDGVPGRFRAQTLQPVSSENVISCRLEALWTDGVQSCPAGSTPYSDPAYNNYYCSRPQGAACTCYTNYGYGPAYNNGKCPGPNADVQDNCYCEKLPNEWCDPDGDWCQGGGTCAVRIPGDPPQYACTNRCGDGAVGIPYDHTITGTSCDGNDDCAKGYCVGGIPDDGQRDGVCWESCDDGNTNNEDRCKNNCMENTCGDGVVNRALQTQENGGNVGAPFEECDDGNTLAMDGCNNACQKEYCGDGYVHLNYGGYPGSPIIKNNAVVPCTIGGPPCEKGSCYMWGGGHAPDGTVPLGYYCVEECDDGNTDNTDGCTDKCRSTTCGNGFVDPGEQCDPAEGTPEWYESQSQPLNRRWCDRNICEWNQCSNGKDDDADRAIDGDDPGCWVPEEELPGSGSVAFDTDSPWSFLDWMFSAGRSLLGQARRPATLVVAKGKPTESGCPKGLVSSPETGLCIPELKCPVPEIGRDNVTVVSLSCHDYSMELAADDNDAPGYQNSLCCLAVNEHSECIDQLPYSDCVDMIQSFCVCQCRNGNGAAAVETYNTCNEDTNHDTCLIQAVRTNCPVPNDDGGVTGGGGGSNGGTIAGGLGGAFGGVNGGGAGTTGGATGGGFGGDTGGVCKNFPMETVASLCPRMDCACGYTCGMDDDGNCGCIPDGSPCVASFGSVSSVPVATSSSSTSSVSLTSSVSSFSSAGAAVSPRATSRSSASSSSTNMCGNGICEAGERPVCPPGTVEVVASSQASSRPATVAYATSSSAASALPLPFDRLSSAPSGNGSQASACTRVDTECIASVPGEPAPAGSVGTCWLDFSVGGNMAPAQFGYLVRTTNSCAEPPSRIACASVPLCTAGTPLSVAFGAAPSGAALCTCMPSGAASSAQRISSLPPVTPPAASSRTSACMRTECVPQDAFDSQYRDRIGQQVGGSDIIQVIGSCAVVTGEYGGLGLYDGFLLSVPCTEEASQFVCPAPEKCPQPTFYRDRGSCLCNLPQCYDNLDNDGDGAIDMKDFSCVTGGDNDEANPKSQCQDGRDNDADLLMDYPGDPGCANRQDNDESPQHCSSYIGMDGKVTTGAPPAGWCRGGQRVHKNGVCSCAMVLLPNASPLVGQLVTTPQGGTCAQDCAPVLCIPVTSSSSSSSRSCIPGTLCPNGAVCPPNGICPSPSSSASSSTPSLYCTLFPQFCVQSSSTSSQRSMGSTGGSAFSRSSASSNLLPSSRFYLQSPSSASSLSVRTSSRSSSPACVPGTLCPNGAICPPNGICPSPSSSASSSTPSLYCTLFPQFCVQSSSAFSQRSSARTVAFSTRSLGSLGGTNGGGYTGGYLGGTNGGGTPTVATCNGRNCESFTGFCESLGQVCRETMDTPCFACVPRLTDGGGALGGNVLTENACTGQECENLGVLCASQGTICAQLSQAPCMACAPLACTDDTDCTPGTSCQRGICSAIALADPALCGNALRDRGEECDDGNVREFDGCSADCLLERGICGDGVVQSLLDEQCEPGFPDPAMPYVCGADCRFSSGLCGNGALNPGEQCDNGTSNSERPNAACRTNCSTARCGDGIVDGLAEQCDDGNRVGGDGCSRTCSSEHPSLPFASLNPAVFTVEQPFAQPFAQSPLIATVTPQGPITESGPATAAAMAVGASAGIAWVRRRRQGR